MRAASGFLAPADAKSRTLEVASANWHASAALIARRYADALLVDVGTTTTDLIPIGDGAVAARGATDAERLTEGELLYTGVVRTPVMAVAHSAPFKGRVQRLAAERFATMADVWRLTGDLPGDADPYPTADQRGKSARESAARLARMLGRDESEGELGEWVALARYFADCQLGGIEEAARALLAREGLPPDAPVVGAGCGRFVAKALAETARPAISRLCRDHRRCARSARDGSALCPSRRCCPARSDRGMKLTFSSCAYSGSPRSACRCLPRSRSGGPRHRPRRRRRKGLPAAPSAS